MSEVDGKGPKVRLNSTQNERVVRPRPADGGFTAKCSAGTWRRRRLTGGNAQISVGPTLTRSSGNGVSELKYGTLEL